MRRVLAGDLVGDEMMELESISGDGRKRWSRICSPSSRQGLDGDGMPGVGAFRSGDGRRRGPVSERKREERMSVVVAPLLWHCGNFIVALKQRNEELKVYCRTIKHMFFFSLRSDDSWGVAAARFNKQLPRVSL